jgi:hypothetical protein
MWQKLSNYGLKLHIQQQPFPKTLIGIDFGMKSTGLAITSSDILHAFVSIAPSSTSQPSAKTSARGNSKMT